MYNKSGEILMNLRNKQMKELGGYKNILIANKFEFSKDGIISNMCSRLNELFEIGEKEGTNTKLIEEIKNINDIVGKYIELLCIDIPKTNYEILNLKYELR